MAELLQIVGFAFVIFLGYEIPLVTASAPAVLRPAALVWLLALLIAFVYYWPNLTT